MIEQEPSDENLSPAEKLRRDLQKMKSGEQEIFQAFLSHSKDYQQALGLTDEQLEFLERKQPKTGAMYPTAEDWYQAALTKISIDDQNFAIVAKNVCIHPYGNFSASGGWQNLLMAIARDESLNSSEGHGTSWITVVPEEWHSRIIEYLQRKEEPGKNSLKYIGPNE